VSRELIVRSYPLADLEVRKAGDGRTVVAYAAAFDTPYEVHDHMGDYMERNSPRAFTKTLQEKGLKFGVYYNHGMTIHGTPSDTGSQPLGVPKVVRAESKGLLTETWYLPTPFGDAILEAVRAGAITAYSHTSGVMKSDPAGKVPRVSRSGALPTVTRLELALKEYGPAAPALAVSSAAAVVGVRAQSLHSGLSANDRATLLYELLTASGTAHQPSAPVTPPPGADPVESRKRSSRNRIEIRSRIARTGALTWKHDGGTPQT